MYWLASQRCIQRAVCLFVIIMIITILFLFTTHPHLLSAIYLLGLSHSILFFPSHTLILSSTRTHFPPTAIPFPKQIMNLCFFTQIN